MSKEYMRRWRRLLVTAVMIFVVTLTAFQLPVKMEKTSSAGDQPTFGGELSSLGTANGWLNSQPLTAASLRGKSRPHRFLDLHLHQLAAYPSLCTQLGREIQRSGPGCHRCART
jgi:hypothetical protein